MSEPQFDTSKKALQFALNHEARIAKPAMAQMVADGRVRRIELADGSHVTVAGSTRAQSKRIEGLQGLDGAATAGFVLQVLASLPDEQQLVLIAECCRPRDPCACRAPCCSGSRPNARWVAAVSTICAHLKDEAQLSRIAGKKGMSTTPRLRYALVEKFFVPGKEFALARVAKDHDVSEQTVINHRRPIITYLDKQQTSAWRAVDEALTSAGIVGATS